MWKKLSSKTIFTHPRITLVEDKVKLPNGQKTDYLRFENDNNFAAVLCKRKDGKVLMQKEYAYPSNRKLFQFPGGVIRLNEDMAEGANRELMEESKIKANNLELIGKFVINNRRSDAMLYVFLGTELEESYLKSDAEEEIENVWLSEDEIITMIREESEIVEHDALSIWAIYLSQKSN